MFCKAIVWKSHTNDKGNLETISIGEAGDRVIEGKESEFMHDKDEFICHSSLQPEYLKNDCLKFRITSEWWLILIDSSENNTNTFTPS